MQVMLVPRGWVVGSHQIWYDNGGGGSIVKHQGNGVTFQQYSPVPGQPCPIDLCDCP